MKLDLENLTDKQGLAVLGFNERLTELLPGLHTHRYSKDRPGGFIEHLP